MTDQLTLDLNAPQGATQARLRAFPHLSHIRIPRFHKEGYRDVLRVHYEGDDVRLLHGGDYCFLGKENHND